MNALAAALLAELDDETLDALAQRLTPRLAARLGDCTNDRPWLNSDEAAAYLDCPRSRIHDLVQLRKLAPRRDGRRLLFKRVDLEAYLEGTP